MLATSGPSVNSNQQSSDKPSFKDFKFLGVKGKQSDRILQNGLS